MCCIRLFGLLNTLFYFLWFIVTTIFLSILARKMPTPSPISLIVWIFINPLKIIVIFYNKEMPLDLFLNYDVCCLHLGCTKLNHFLVHCTFLVLTFIQHKLNLFLVLGLVFLGERLMFFIRLPLNIVWCSVNAISHFASTIHLSTWYAPQVINPSSGLATP